MAARVEDVRVYVRGKPSCETNDLTTTYPDRDNAGRIADQLQRKGYGVMRRAGTPPVLGSR
jgi:hypothetical protein